MATRPVGTFAQASNEMALKQFTDAALSNQTDNTNSISSRIIIGALALIGPDLPPLEETDEIERLIRVRTKHLELNYEKLGSIDSF